MQGNWNYPTPIRFGAGRVKEAGDACRELGMKKPLIVTDAALRLVYVVGEDGIVQPRTVELGPLSGSLRVIRSGIGPEDQVVINGLLRARPGAPVTPEPGEITRDAPAEGEGAPAAPPPGAPLASVAAPAGSLPMHP